MVIFRDVKKDVNIILHLTAAATTREAQVLTLRCRAMLRIDTDTHFS